MDVVGAVGTMAGPGAPLLLRPGGWAWGICISGLTVTVDTEFGEVGRGGAGGSAWFMWEREHKEEWETMLRMRLRRLPVEEDRVRGCVLLLTFTLLWTDFPYRL